uniref:Uncharacterized protein n=1 Tax=Romanomermis culicivorax TaxID=13658 RepID=A0A915KSS3_ROMCU
MQDRDDWYIHKMIKGTFIQMVSSETIDSYNQQYGQQWGTEAVAQYINKLLLNQDLSPSLRANIIFNMFSFVHQMDWIYNYNNEQTQELIKKLVDEEFEEPLEILVTDDEISFYYGNTEA